MQATAIMAPRAPRIVAWSRMGDESLARRAAAGDSAAFTAIYERYHGPLLAYCRSILLETEDARDATQAALENALRALPRREPGRALRPWLYRIAHNESINIVRRRRPTADVDPADVLTVPGPEADAEQRTRLSQLVDDLRMLPERQRGALVMRELSGLSYAEIGQTLGLSGDAARRAVFDARNSLHDAVDGRATACVSVRRSLSDGDRRHLRARGIRAHLRSCDDCATFERAMGARQTDLHALGSWLGGASALGLVGLGASGAGAACGATLMASASGGAAAAGGGLGWAGLPVAAKGLAVAAVVATTGTAAVELPKVVRQDAPAPVSQATIAPGRGAAPAPAAAVSPTYDLVRERALAQAAAQRRRSARTATSRSGRPATFTAGRARARSGLAAAAPGASAQPAPASAPPASAAPPAAPGAARQPAAPQPAARQPAAAAPASRRPPQRRPAPAPARTPQGIAIASLERVREQLAAAFAAAQTAAASGRPSGVQTADALIQRTLASVRPAVERILAGVGLALPASALAAPAAVQSTAARPPASAALAPAQSLLGGVDAALRKLFSRRGHR